MLADPGNGSTTSVDICPLRDKIELLIFPTSGAVLKNGFDENPPGGVVYMVIVYIVPAR
jgi:hypothetical protein